MKVEEIRARLVAFPVLGLNAVAGLISRPASIRSFCDPDDIGRAHRLNEYIETSELAACQQIIAHLGVRLAT
jgi:acetylornithine deacetylase